ncbi:hypothetical protein MTR67_011007 [Solanum verrucosum]|uniref:Hop-interacting protein n=1 Tax=Solanum verrucosum TaxID=315347 RepID=A0AAF0Q628_SOLVR|nr:uncharacterized protein LOC125810931 [Solanum verrucosum]WMV17622.1 hypothetical protein MTR67_011007 [Solanum verrucosum]
MRREGRQHGMVRTYPILPSPWNPRPEPRYMNKSNSLPTAGLFAKVPTKPSNHSKFTGKCGRPRCTSCHIHPAGKSKDKTKGTQKIKGCGDVVSLVTWRVVDAMPGLNFSGFSATGILDHLDSDCSYYMDHDDHDIYYDAADEGYGDQELVVDSDWSPAIGVEIEETDEEKMSFCEVGFVWENVEEDEDWCVVEGI